MPGFTKKPVQIEGRQLLNTEESARELMDWIDEDVHYSPDSNPDGSDVMHFLIIGTLEGRMLASPGDWIIRGVKGEFYTCKPDIFEATYDPA